MISVLFSCNVLLCLLLLLLLLLLYPTTSGNSCARVSVDLWKGRFYTQALELERGRGREWGLISRTLAEVLLEKYRCIIQFGCSSGWTWLNLQRKEGRLQLLRKLLIRTSLMLIHDGDGCCVKPWVKRAAQTLRLFQPECVHNTFAGKILCCIAGSNVKADFVRGWDAVGTAQRVGAMKIKKL